MPGAIFSAWPARNPLQSTSANEGVPPLRWGRVLLLLLVLPLFGQSFHYVKALRPLWALSKAFPLLSLPLALLLLRGERPRVARQLLLSMLWLFLVPSLTAIFSFQQNFFLGLTAQVKLLPLLYFFSFLALLRWLAPSSRELATGFLICAGVTFALLLTLWVAAPQSWYSGTYIVGDSPIFSVDGRGDRIRMPMYFGMIGLFFCARKLHHRHQAHAHKVTWLLLAATGFALVVSAVRTRAMVIGLVVVTTLNAIRWAHRKARLVLVAMLPFALALLFTVPYLRSIFATDQTSGLYIRLTTFSQATDFLGTNPLNWLLGVGTITPLDPAGLISYFNHFFFLADISWLGVAFEYGLIGALLFLLFPLRGLYLFRNIRGRGRNPFLGSLRDYLLYVLAISPFYPLTLAPGEVAIILAIFVYTLERQSSQDTVRSPDVAEPGLFANKPFAMGRALL